MAFPDDPVPLTVELDLVGDWSDPTDITSKVYSRAPVTITRGRTAEGGTVDPSTLSLTLNNRDGNFSPRNPTGDYFGKLGRNTPIRASVNMGKTRFAALAGETGGVFFTADSAQQDITGDLDVRLDCYLRQWRKLAGLVYKWGDPSQRSYFLQLNADGTLTLFWSTTGANSLSSTSTQQVPFTTGHYSVRATLDVNNGSSGNTVTFYWGTGGVDGTWTQLGDAVTTSGTTSIFNSTSAVAVDAGAGVAANGNEVYAAQVRSGIAGTIKANPDFTAQTDGATSFTDSVSALWQTLGSTVTSKRIRFVGEVAAWPVKWDPSGQDVYVEIQAAGVLRRLSQGASPLWDPVRRLAVREGAAAYWPLSDAPGTIDASSGVGGRKLTFSSFNTTGITVGRPSFGDGSIYPYLPPAMATAPAPVGDFSGGELTGVISVGSTSTDIAMDVLYRATEGFNDDDLPLNTQFFVYTSTGLRWHWLPTNNFADIEVSVWRGDSALIDGGSFDAGDLFDGQAHHVRLAVSTVNSTTQQYVLYIDGVQVSTDSFVTGRALGAPRKAVISYFSDSVQSQVNPVYLGHFTVWSGTFPTVSDAVDASLGHAGETAGERLTRLADEEDLSLVILGDSDDTEDMGPQRAATLVELLQECAVTDQGLLFEPRDTGGLAYLTRVGLQSQNAVLSLDYDSKHLSLFEPVEDDSAIRNDVTMTDTFGAAFQATQDDGPLSTDAPPSGAGRYQESLIVNPDTSGQLPDLAGWRLHLGTVDEARYPAIGIGLHRSVFTGSDDLTTDALDLDLGQVLLVTDVPAWLPPDDVLQMVQGVRETLSNFTYDVEFSCAPASPWTVGIYDDTEFRYHSDNSSLSASASSSATSLSVATTSGPLWGHGDGDFDIIVGGERMTVTAISGTTSPQTFTVTRSVNGVTKAQDSGSTVDLFQPTIYAI